MKLMRRAAFLASVLLALAGCGAQEKEPFGGGSAAGGQNSSAAFAGASEEVQALFKNRCLSCHGSELEGRVSGNSNLQQVGARLTKEQIADTIQNGNKNGMPSFGSKLKPEEVNALADWLATKK